MEIKAVRSRLDVLKDESLLDESRDELLYMNNRIDQLVQLIKANSITPAIIIIQGDLEPPSGLTSERARMSMWKNSLASTHAEETRFIT